jgi:23S rRNA pseudouridine1911/1915/1917 synthase
MSETESPILLEIPVSMSGFRIDKALSDLLPEHSRSAIQEWIGNGQVRIRGSNVKQKQKVAAGEQIEVNIIEKIATESEPENIPLDIIFEDNQILVLNKPAGLVVHPGAGHQQGTLLNGLLYYDSNLEKLPRAGIVHRLDKDTTGIMVVARTEKARQHLIAQLEVRSMKRQYKAVVEGIMISGETINQPIGRHRHDRVKMCVTPSGKTAITHIRVLEKFRSHTLVQANLESGRTHQIRVHLSWRGYSLVGDTVYGNRKHIPPSSDPELITVLQNFKRQALHAEKLSLIHPDTNDELSWSVDPPEDFNTLINVLKQDGALQS